MLVEIKTTVEYCPKLNFDFWAKSCALGLKKEEQVRYTKVKCSAYVENGNSWSKNGNKSSCWEQLVVQCASQYGLVLEGKNYYFTREYEELDNGRLGCNLTVTLFVAE